MFEETRVGVLAYMAYHDRIQSRMAAYVDMAIATPCCSASPRTQDRQLENVMTASRGLAGCKKQNWNRMSNGICGRHSWLDRVHLRVCRQRIIDPTTDAERLADSCAHTLLDAIARVPDIPRHCQAMATARHVPQQ